MIKEINFSKKAVEKITQLIAKEGFSRSLKILLDLHIREIEIE